MKVANKIFILAVFGTFLVAQTEPIFFGQQKAIQSLSAQAGFSDAQLNTYIKQRYGKELYELSQAQGAALITDFQNGQISLDDIQPKFVSSPQLSEAERKKLLTAASVLEKGMKKRFSKRANAKIKKYCRTICQTILIPHKTMTVTAAMNQNH